MEDWKEMTPEEKQWEDAKEKLHGQMLSGTHYHLFYGSRLVSLDPAVVEVRGPGQKEFLERSWADRVAEALGVTAVTFQVVAQPKEGAG